MLSGGGLQRGCNEIACECYESSGVRLAIYQKLGKHVRRFQRKIASLLYGFNNLATFRLESLAEGVAMREGCDKYNGITICQCGRNETSAAVQERCLTSVELDLVAVAKCGWPLARAARPIQCSSRIAIELELARS